MNLIILKIVNDFPSNRQDFDSEIGNLSMGGEFEYKLKKIYNSQKGILLGLFIDSNELYWKLEPTKINITTLTGEEDDKKDKQKEQEDNPDSSYLGFGGIIAFIVSCIIVIGLIIWRSKRNDCCELDCARKIHITLIKREENYYINRKE